MRKDAGEPLYFLSQNPKGWADQSIPTLRARAQRAFLEASGNPIQELSDQQRQRWIAKTGELPEDSRFTLIVPIHNEQKFLHSFLGTLMMSDIPSSVHANVLFITNTCSDKSREMVSSFMESLGEVIREPIRIDTSDDKLSDSRSVVQVGNLSFQHLNTETKGKANALTLGNAFALQSGHGIAMSVDANNFLEPDAIPSMYTHARQVLADGETVILDCSKVNHEVKPSKITHLLRRSPRYGNKFYNSHIHVSGQFMAWSPSWLSEIGGVPPVASEDYAMGVMAKKEGKTVYHTDDVQLWGYRGNSLSDALSTRARAVRGALQLLHFYPEVEDIVKKDNMYVRPLTDRLKEYSELVKSHPSRFPLMAGFFLFWEASILKGKYDYMKDPQNQSWDPIQSTK